MARFIGWMTIDGDLATRSRVTVVVGNQDLEVFDEGESLGTFSLQSLGAADSGAAIALRLFNERVEFVADDMDVFRSALRRHGVLVASQVPEVATSAAAGSGVRSGPAKFWKADSWRTWRSDRTSWRDYKTEHTRLKGEASTLSSDVGRHQSEAATAERAAAIAADVGEREVPIKTARSEAGLAVVPGITLLDLRSAQGQKAWTLVDQGSLFYTDRQMVFSGTKDVKFRYDNITEVEETDLGVHVEVSSRKRSHILAGDALQIVTVLAAAQEVVDQRDQVGCEQVDTVNTASRMESSGESDRVNISEATYEHVKHEPDLLFTPAARWRGRGS